MIEDPGSSQLNSNSLPKAVPEIPMENPAPQLTLQQQDNQPKNGFKYKKQLLFAVIILIAILLYVGGYFTYKNFVKKEPSKNEQNLSEEIQRVNDEQLKKIHSSSSPLTIQTWNECKVFENLRDYYIVNGKSTEGYLPGMLDRVPASEGDPITLQKRINDEFSAYKGKEINGAFVIDVKIKNYYSYEALIWLGRYTDAKDGQQKVGAQLLSFINPHKMIVKLGWESKGDFQKEADDLYATFFKNTCKPLS